MSTITSIFQLSPEILTEIFLHLELPDRKSVRLSCKSFYDACNQISIISQEKFVFRSGYCFQDITKTLPLCQYLRLNLEFQGFLKYSYPRKIWTHCGDRIYSLTFHHSLVNDKIVENVITRCRNLKHWKVWVDRDDLYSWNSSGLQSIKAFDKLFKRKIVHKRLETFEVCIVDKKMLASIIEKIFTIFPNIKSFGACFFSYLKLYDLYSLTHTVFAFPCIKDYLRCTCVERLRFDVPSDGRWMKNSSVRNLRLKEIQASLNPWTNFQTLYHIDKMLEALFDFFSHQKQLEVVHLTVYAIPARSFKKLLLFIIKVFPNLRRLHLNYPTTYIIELNEDEFSLLLKKRLEFLDLRFDVNDSQANKILTTVKLPVNRNLHTLVINSYLSSKSSESNFVLFMEYFQNLKHLDLSYVTDAVLQSIIKNQASLKILKFQYKNLCTDFGFTGRRGNVDPLQPGYTIRRLKNLQCLSISSWFFGLLSEDTFLEFVFPKLKHFHFDMQLLNLSVCLKNFIRIAENAPMLEILILDSTILDFSQLLDFCCNLKNLYYVDADAVGLDYFRLIRSCPSLRFLAHRDRRKIYYINPVTKKKSLKWADAIDIHSKCSVEFPIILK